VSQGNRWRTRKAGSHDDIGGDFFTQKKFYVGNPQRVKIQCGSFDFNQCRRDDTFFEGDILPCSPSQFSFPPASNSSDAQLNVLGAKAVGLAMPTPVVTDLSVTLAEGLQNIPKIGADVLKGGIQTAKNAGSDFLNLEFGWKPLIADLSKTFGAMETFEDQILQWNRDVNKSVRRKTTLPSVTSTELIGAGTFVPFGGNDTTLDSQLLARKFGAVVIRRELTRRTWFSGEFVYKVGIEIDTSTSGFSGLMAKARNLSRVLKTDITPDTLWNLAPWSWAIDWFSSAGDVIANAENFTKYGLVMRYGYLMEHTIVKDTYSRVLPEDSFTGVNRFPVTSSFSLITETKTRRRANPFGFGVSWSGLSPHQLSIAAALGVSRG